METRLTKMRIFLVVLIFLICAASARAQDACTVALNEAQDKFESGKLYEVHDIIKSCIEDGFSKEQKIAAYRLMTITYLYLNYYDKADSTYLNLLRLSPEYRIDDEQDPIEFIKHQAKFTTDPIYYMIPIKLGMNLSFANVLMDYSISSAHDGSDMYSVVPGFHVGIGAERVLYRNLHLAAEIMLTNQKIHLRDTHWDFYTTDLDFNHTRLELPILLKYYFPLGRINPFVQGGVSPSYMLNSSFRNIEGFYKVMAEDGTDDQFPAQPRPEISASGMNHEFNYSAVVGAGINYKLGLNYLSFEVRYSMQMLNVTRKDDRWSENTADARTLKFPTGHVSDDFRLNTASFLVGFVRPLYKPRKIK
jgi:hypothetical protein